MAAVLKLQEIKTQFVKSDRNLEAHLKASFPHPGDEEKVRRLFREDIGKDNLGLGAHWQGDADSFCLSHHGPGGPEGRLKNAPTETRRKMIAPRREAIIF